MILEMTNLREGSMAGTNGYMTLNASRMFHWIPDSSFGYLIGFSYF